MGNNQDLRSALEKIVGQKVLKISAGENTGSIINLEFGEKLKTVKAGRYEFLEGDYSIMINCAWRLGNRKSVITSWHESNVVDGPMLKGLELIKGQKIVSVELAEYYDLTIKLEKELELSIFCDLSANQSIDTNWFFREGSINYIINNQYQLV